MLQIKSSDGVYKISAPDDAKTAFKGTDYDMIQDVFIEEVDGKNKANVANLAYAIYHYCFDNGCLGLRLLSYKLRCHIKTQKSKYEFTLDDYAFFDDLLNDVASKVEL